MISILHPFTLGSRFCKQTKKETLPNLYLSPCLDFGEKMIVFVRVYKYMCEGKSYLITYYQDKYLMHPPVKENTYIKPHLSIAQHVSM
jgi:hypothetical protein